MIILDVPDELGQRLEVQSAAPEMANVGEEGGGGDACHCLCYIEEQQHGASGKEIARTHARTVRQTAAAAAAGAAQHERERERRAQHVIPVDVKFCTLVLLHKPLCVSFMGDSSLEIFKKKNTSSKYVKT